jgi:hypothetical protein
MQGIENGPTRGDRPPSVSDGVRRGAQAPIGPDGAAGEREASRGPPVTAANAGAGAAAPDVAAEDRPANCCLVNHGSVRPQRRAPAPASSTVCVTSLATFTHWRA